MKAKTTTQQSKEHENFVTSLFAFDNARNSRSSGAAWNDRIDIVSDTFCIEAESTETKSTRITEEDWQEVWDKAYGGRIPLLARRFRSISGKHIDLAVISLDDLAELLEKINDLTEANG